MTEGKIIMYGREPLGLDSLPNEVLLQILTPFATPTLLRLSLLSHRFASLTHRIYYHRLTITAQIEPRTLLIECYHPSLRLTAEPLMCAPLGTPELTSSPDMTVHPVDRIRLYNSLYSRFRPYRRSSDGGRAARQQRHPAGDVPGSRTFPEAVISNDTQLESADEGSSQGQESSAVDPRKLPPVKQPINLDASEMFTQLTTITSLVQVGSKSGLFYSANNVSEGVIRMFRSWLAEHSTDLGSATEKDGLQWVNDGMNVGVRFIIEERKWARTVAPVLVSVDEDVAVSYDIEIREVLVRTRHLVHVTEQSLQEQQNIGNRAIIIGGWG